MLRKIFLFSTPNTLSPSKMNDSSYHHLPHIVRDYTIEGFISMCGIVVIELTRVLR